MELSLEKLRAVKARMKTHYDTIMVTDYKEPKVDIETFLCDDRFLGKSTNKGEAVFPVWKRALVESFCHDEKFLIVLTGSVRTGKTTIAVYGLAYILYELLLLRNPWEHFGLARSSKMAIIFFNLSKTLGGSRGYAKLQACLAASPWFRERASRITETKIGDELTFSLVEFLLASPYCFTGDTKVSLLDGRELEMTKIVEELPQKELWVYSYDLEKRRIVPGKIIKAWKTGTNTKTLKVTLDNGEVISCTPNHRFMLRSGEYVEAQELKSGDSLMPLYRKLDDYGYEQFEDVERGQWFYTHRRMVGALPVDCRGVDGRFIKDVLVHHDDCNKRNNNPPNLIWMTDAEHKAWHHAHLEKTLHSPEARRKNRESIRATYANNQELKDRIAAAVSDSWTPERRIHHSKIISQFMSNGQAMGMVEKAWLPENRAKNIASRKLYWESPAGLMDKQKRRERLLNGQSKMMNNLKKGEILNNHKVVSVQEGDYEDVYDLEIGNYHNFALSAGVFVHNSQGYGIVGSDVVGGLLDEVDSEDVSLSQKKRVLNVYNAAEIRFKTSFAAEGHSLGKLFIVSSKTDELSFMDAFIAERKQFPEVLIFDVPLWEARPASQFCGRTFRVAVGDAFNPPKMIQENEEAEFRKNGYNIILVPVEFETNFKSDIVRALREIAGVTVAGIRKSKLFASKKDILDCMADTTKLNPVKVEVIETGLKDTAEYIKYFDLSRIRMPKDIYRYWHYDIAFSGAGDACALSMCGVREWRAVDVQNEDGSYRKDLVPIVETDFTVRIKARGGDRIPFHKVRKLVLDIRQAGYHIAMFTADLDNMSEDTKQLLLQAGIPTDKLSLDKKLQPYFTFRDIVQEGRWICHRLPLLITELDNLEHDRIEGKIDHPDKFIDKESGGAEEKTLEGSKDLADATAGAVYNAVTTTKKPMNLQLMNQLLKKAASEPQGPEEDMTQLLRPKTGEPIIGTKQGDQLNKINDIFRRIHNR